MAGGGEPAGSFYVDKGDISREIMAYTSFTLYDLRSNFGIRDHVQSLFKDITPLPMSDWLRDTLAMTQQMPLSSEKAKSELVVTPILVELRNRNNNFFTVYSGEVLNVDAAQGLTGECDFILTKDTNAFAISAPIITVVEAKRDDLELGVVQCAAQMVGIQRFNEKYGYPIETVYRCATTADNWQFLRLTGQQLLIDHDKYFISDIEKVLGVFQQIVDYYKGVLVEE